MHINNKPQPQYINLYKFPVKRHFSGQYRTNRPETMMLLPEVWKVILFATILKVATAQLTWETRQQWRNFKVLFSLISYKAVVSKCILKYEQNT